jgi:hypothetical protein
MYYIINDNWQHFISKHRFFHSDKHRPP